MIKENFYWWSNFLQAHLLNSCNHPANTFSLRSSTADSIIFHRRIIDLMMALTHTGCTHNVLRARNYAPGHERDKMDTFPFK